MTYFQALHMWLLLWPKNLCFDWSHDVIPLVTCWEDTRNLLTAGVLVALLIASFSVLRKMVLMVKRWNVEVVTHRNEITTSSAACMGLALLAVPFIPSSNLIFPVGFTVAERVMLVHQK
jgi:hypothetical protein